MNSSTFSLSRCICTIQRIHSSRFMLRGMKEVCLLAGNLSALTNVYLTPLQETFWMEVLSGSHSPSKRNEEAASQISNEENHNANEELVIDIPENIEDTLSPETCIHRVPPVFREVNEAVYAPQVISIGPIHRGNEKLRAMEMQKLRYLKTFSTRVTRTQGKRFPNSSSLVNEIHDFISSDGREVAIRRSYADNFEISSGDFVKMVMLDGIFIVELFLRDFDQSQHANDFILAKPWLRTAIELDLIMLENQLPYFILEAIYEFALKDDKLPSFFDLSCEFFSDLKQKVSVGPVTPLHFTDLVRYFWSLDHPPQHKVFRGIPTVTKLCDAGVKFKALQNACLLDIKFRRAKDRLRGALLEIPCLEVYDNTERIIRNLMAFEQCHYPYEAYVCSYIILLNCLIDTSEDVKVLVDKKIIVNRLGSSRTIAKMVKGLCGQIIVVNSCFYPIAAQLNEHYESYCNGPVARLKRATFRYPWKLVSIYVYAVVVLTLLLRKW